MTSADLFDPGKRSIAIRIDVEYPCTQDRLWNAIVDPDELSGWLGGQCAIEPRVGGEVQFELEADGIVASGAVRAFDPPRQGMRVAFLEHTFVDATRPEVTSVCRWGVTSTPPGCELHFTHDGFAETARNDLAAAWERRFGRLREPDGAESGRASTALADATELLRDAQTVLLVSFIGPEVPSALVKAGRTVHVKTGAEPDAWATAAERDGALVFEPLDQSPAHVDLVHLDVAHAFAEYLEVALTLGAQVFWFHSARTRPPAPHDNRGCWLPSAQSAQQRRAVESAGLIYIDDAYIADAARLIAAP